MTLKAMAILTALVSCLRISVVEAKLIQILHTNDLHSYIHSTGHRPDRGGYAALKALIQKKRQEAKAQGLTTITMNGGDFMEGNIYYLADRGRQTYKTFGKTGHDFVVLGNHDYLMGADELDALLGEVPTPFQFLAANFKADEKFSNINRVIKPYSEIEIDGVKIGVIGITLNDPLYKWRLEGAEISSEIRAAKKYAEILRERGADLIIALTHIGILKDKLLARAVPEIDIIVGGHSHTHLRKPVLIKHREKIIPIVQAGKHGEYLGQLLVDFNKEEQGRERLKVVNYSLELISKKEVQEDPEIVQDIKRMDFILGMTYGQHWLDDEILGMSELKPVHEGGAPRAWGYFITDGLKEGAQTDLGIHAQALSGDEYPIGPINRRALFNSNPRIFEFDDPYGYRVYRIKVPGILLKAVLKVVLRFNLPLYFSGVQFRYETDKKANETSISDIRVKGQELKSFKLYSVAVSEAIVRGGHGITSKVRYILREPERLDLSMWQALENHVAKFPKVGPDYGHGRPKDSKSNVAAKNSDYMFVPPQYDEIEELEKAEGLVKNNEIEEVI